MAELSDKAFMEALGLTNEHQREIEGEQDLRIAMFGLDFEKYIEENKEKETNYIAKNKNLSNFQHVKDKNKSLEKDLK